MSANYFIYFSLSTERQSRSLRADVADAAIVSVAPWLERLVAEGNALPLPAAPLSKYTAKGYVLNGGLLVTVFLFDEPLATFGVAQRSRYGGELWASLLANSGKSGIKQPAAPWCAEVQHLALNEHADVSRWIGDFGKCVAWAWVLRKNKEAQSDDN